MIKLRTSKPTKYNLKYLSPKLAETNTQQRFLDYLQISVFLLISTNELLNARDDCHGCGKENARGKFSHWHAGSLSMTAMAYFFVFNHGQFCSDTGSSIPNILARCYKKASYHSG